jgi:predicted small secreted protein
MKTSLARILLFVVLLTSALASTACNTARGFGQDLEKAGEGIQKAANK